MGEVYCEQLEDGRQHNPRLLIPALEGESAQGTLARKLAGAKRRGWSTDREAHDSFHAWKEYQDGDGTQERPHRRDRYFYVVT